MARKMPVLFVGHGSPMNIIMDNSYTRALAALGKELPRPTAIMVVSAHWLTRGTAVTCAERPRTIHDFYGFPEELYAVSYPCAGAPDAARKAIETVRSVPVACDRAWGLDHASWAVLRHVYPGADVPVFEMSLDYRFGEWNPKPLRYHYDLAGELALLRRQGVLIVGSGNIVHNLRALVRGPTAPYDWAEDFDERAAKAISRRDFRALAKPLSLARTLPLAHPTLEHYLPVLFPLGVADEKDELSFFNASIDMGSISMRSFVLG